MDFCVWLQSSGNISVNVPGIVGVRVAPAPAPDRVNVTVPGLVSVQQVHTCQHGGDGHQLNKMRDALAPVAAFTSSLSNRLALSVDEAQGSRRDCTCLITTSFLACNINFCLQRHA